MRSPRCPTLYGPADDVLARRARAVARHSVDPQCARHARRARRRGGAARRSTAHRSRRPARLSLPERRDLLGVHRRRTHRRSATAAATTASARHSGAHGRRPVSRSTCVSSPTCWRAATAHANLSKSDSHGQERRRHRRPVGRRGQGQDRRLAHRERAGCRALSGRPQRRPYARHRRTQDGAAAHSVGRAARRRAHPDRQRRRAVAVRAAAGNRRARGGRRQGAPAAAHIARVPARAAGPRRTRPGARERARRCEDRHHRPRHRPRVRGQGRAARAARAGSADPERFAEQARRAARAAQLRARPLLQARCAAVRADARRAARAGDARSCR